MNQEVAEGDSDVGRAKLATGSWIRDEVSEAQKAVVEHDDGALVKNFNLCGEGGLEGPHVHQVDHHYGRVSELNRKLYPQEVSNLEDAYDKSDSTGEK